MFVNFYMKCGIAFEKNCELASVSPIVLFQKLWELLQDFWNFFRFHVEKNVNLFLLKCRPKTGDIDKSFFSVGDFQNKCKMPKCMYSFYASCAALC